jgi:hypothetical protein
MWSLALPLGVLGLLFAQSLRSMILIIRGRSRFPYAATTKRDF